MKETDTSVGMTMADVDEGTYRAHTRDPLLGGREISIKPGEEERRRAGLGQYVKLKAYDPVKEKEKRDTAAKKARALEAGRSEMLGMGEYEEQDGTTTKLLGDRSEVMAVYDPDSKMKEEGGAPAARMPFEIDPVRSGQIDRMGTVEAEDEDGRDDDAGMYGDGDEMRWKAGSGGRARTRTTYLRRRRRRPTRIRRSRTPRRR